MVVVNSSIKLTVNAKPAFGVIAELQARANTLVRTLEGTGATVGSTGSGGGGGSRASTTASNTALTNAVRTMARATNELTRAVRVLSGTQVSGGSGGTVVTGSGGSGGTSGTPVVTTQALNEVITPVADVIKEGNNTNRRFMSASQRSAQIFFERFSQQLSLEAFDRNNDVVGGRQRVEQNRQLRRRGSALAVLTPDQYARAANEAISQRLGLQEALRSRTGPSRALTVLSPNQQARLDNEELSQRLGLQEALRSRTGPSRALAVLSPDQQARLDNDELSRGLAQLRFDREVGPGQRRFEARRILNQEDRQRELNRTTIRTTRTTFGTSAPPPGALAIYDPVLARQAQSGLQSFRASVENFNTRVQRRFAESAESTRAFFRIFLGRAILSGVANLTSFLGRLDDVRRAIVALNPSAIEGARDLTFLLDTARSLGTGFDSLLRNFRLYTAGVRSVFAETEAGNRILRQTFANLQGFLRISGATSQEQFNAVRAIIDIVSKEGANAGQELRRQLTNSVTDFRNILRDAFNSDELATEVRSFQDILDGLGDGTISVFEFLVRLTNEFAARTRPVIAEIRESLGTALNNFSTSITELGIALASSGALGGITALVNGLTKLVEVFSNFARVHPFISGGIVLVTALAGAVAGLALIVGSLGPIFGRGSAGLSAFVTRLIRFSTNRVTLAIGAFTILGAAVAKVTGLFGGFSRTVEEESSPALQNYSKELEALAGNRAFGNSVRQQAEEIVTTTNSLVSRAADEFSNFLFDTQRSFGDFLIAIAQDLARSGIRQLFQNIFTPVMPEEAIQEAVDAADAVTPTNVTPAASSQTGLFGGIIRRTGQEQDLDRVLLEASQGRVPDGPTRAESGVVGIETDMIPPAEPLTSPGPQPPQISGRFDASINRLTDPNALRDVPSFLRYVALEGLRNRVDSGIENISTAASTLSDGASTAGSFVNQTVLGAAESLSRGTFSLVTLVQKLVTVFSGSVSVTINDGGQLRQGELSYDGADGVAVNLSNIIPDSEIPSPDNNVDGDTA